MDDAELTRRNLVRLSDLVGYPLEEWQVAYAVRLLGESSGRESDPRPELATSATRDSVGPSRRKFHAQPGRT